MFRKSCTYLMYINWQWNHHHHLCHNHIHHLQKFLPALFIYCDYCCYYFVLRTFNIGSVLLINFYILLLFFPFTMIIWFFLHCSSVTFFLDDFFISFSASSFVDIFFSLYGSNNSIPLIKYYQITRNLPKYSSNWVSRASMNSCFEEQPKCVWKW